MKSTTVLDCLKHGTTVKRAMLFLEMTNLRKIVFKIVFIERTCRDVNYVNQLCHSSLHRSLVIPSVKNASKVLNPFEGSIQFCGVNFKKGYETCS